MTNRSAPLVASNAHPPRPRGEIATLDGLDDVRPARGRLNAPMEAVVAVLELERAREAAEWHAPVVDGQHEVIELRALQSTRFDHLTPAAEIAALDAVGDDAAE